MHELVKGQIVQLKVDFDCYYHKFKAEEDIFVVEAILMEDVLVKILHKEILLQLPPASLKLACKAIRTIYE